MTPPKVTHTNTSGLVELHKLCTSMPTGFLGKKGKLSYFVSCPATIWRFGGLGREGTRDVTLSKIGNQSCSSRGGVSTSSQGSHMQAAKMVVVRSCHDFSRLSVEKRVV